MTEPQKTPAAYPCTFVGGPYDGYQATLRAATSFVVGRTSDPYAVNEYRRVDNPDTGAYTGFYEYVESTLPVTEGPTYDQLRDAISDIRAACYATGGTPAWVIVDDVIEILDNLGEAG